MDNLMAYFLFSCLFGISIGTGLRIALRRRETKIVAGEESGRILLKNLRNEEYWGIFTVGTPPQTFEAIFDTGSELLWVPNKRCSNCYGKSVFDEKKSRTFVDLNKTTSISYGVGYMEGVDGMDNVNLAGIEVKNQKLTTALKTTFHKKQFDGVIGLTFTPDESDAVTSIVDNFLKQKLLTKNILSFYMNRKGGLNDGGELVIGGWNEHLFNSSSIDYIPTESYNWQFTIDSMYFGKEKMPCSKCSAIPDTGSTMIVGPLDQVMIIINKAKAKELQKGYYFVKCETVDSLPAISFVISNKTYTLKGKDYSFAPFRHPGYCLLGLVGDYTNIDWVLGNIFLANYYSIFDIEKRRVAFAPLNVPLK